MRMDPRSEVFSFLQQSTGIFLSPSASSKNSSHRPSNVAFSDVVMLHTNENVTNSASAGEKNICSSEKMTQAGDGNVWQVGSTPFPLKKISSRYEPFPRSNVFTCP
jgi:hypothetical protein